MRISFNQPAFIPWGGFFGRLISSDRMILLDETVFARGFTYVNRNRLKGPEGDIWLTVPIRRKGRGRQFIRDLEIDEKAKWSRKFLLTLRHYYGNSLHYESITPRVEQACSAAGDSFLNVTRELLRIIVETLGVAQEFVLQSSIGATGKGTPLLVSIARELGAEEVILPYGAERAVDVSRFTAEGISVFVLRYLPIPYPQFWGDFRANLSALDLLLCAGPDGLGVIKKSGRLLRAA